MKNYGLSAALILAFSIVFYGQEKSLKPPEVKVNRIKPSEFEPSPNCPKMPSNIVRYLENLSCTIPQTTFDKKNGGAFQIQFANRGQTDWAVLCSKNGYSSILIFWKSLTHNVSEFAKYPDEDFVDGNGYFRSIGRDSEKSLTKNNVGNYGGIISKINTVGIDETLPDRNRVIYYFHENQLVTLEWVINPLYSY